MVLNRATITCDAALLGQLDLDEIIIIWNYQISLKAGSPTIKIDNLTAPCYGKIRISPDPEGIEVEGYITPTSPEIYNYFDIKRAKEFGGNITYDSSGGISVTSDEVINLGAYGDFI
jgi:hypothetical protein